MKTNLDSIFDQLAKKGWKATLPRSVYEDICAAGFRSKNLPLAIVAADIASQEQPMTLRGLLYRLVSAGWLPSTDNQHYRRVGRLLTTLREGDLAPFSWIVDHVRSTIKPSSWSGLADFVQTVRDAYRKDFWERLPSYVHVFCEKDAVAGTLAPVTGEFDVSLSPIRGYCSVSFAHEIADLWNRIDKPIHVYYLGDFDPSGFDLERDLREKLRYCRRSFDWERLAVLDEDFDAFGLIPLKPKKSDCRYKAFVSEHGGQCAELDALPATELRQRIQDVIESHIPTGEWQRLQDIERVERASFIKVLAKLKVA